ncbi:hypothetical protein GCM10027341_49890 [Spirosoma knui]
MRHVLTVLFLVTCWLSLSAQTRLPQLERRNATPATTSGQLKRVTAPAKATITRPLPNGRLAAATSQTFTYLGQIVTWTVPAGVTSLTIEARGAEGGKSPDSNFPAGKGAIITGTVLVTPGQSLSILVGQKPVNDANGGGGGTFVISGANQPLVIAGGGGGGGVDNDSDQKHGQAGTSGGAGAGGGGAGGTDGQGGKSLSLLGAGGGLRTDGGSTGNYGGKAFVNGGAGGTNGNGIGGFGGGGFGGLIAYGGGGGGYSGGGAGGTRKTPSAGGSDYGVGGGGGSFNGGTNPSSKTGATDGNSGNGLVIISYEVILPIRYVKQGGTGDGSSWQQASGNLQAMINAEGVQQVWVAGGRYQPAANSSFAMKEAVAIYGGFVGTESSLSERPAVIPVSGQPSSSTLAGNGNSVIINPTDLTNSARLDGFVITGGNAVDGGGIFNAYSNPIISNCVLQANTASRFGGGIAIAYSNPSLVNCVIQTNNAEGGGGIANINSNPNLINCVLQANTAIEYGGGVLNASNSSPSLTNCVLQANTANSGGGIYNFENSPSLINCILSQNRAGAGAALSNEFSSQPSMINTILWDNQESIDNAIVNTNNSSVTANYCLIGEGERDYAGTGNLVATRSPFLSATDLRLNPCSEAINTGDPASTTATSGATDLAGQPRIFGGRIDIGAYEYQANPTQLVVSLANSGPLSFTNATVTLTATAGQGYSYSFSQGTQQPTGNTARVTTPGIYSVTVISSEGCTATASTTVLGGNNPTVCRGGTAVIIVTVGSGVVKYEWYKNSLTSPKLMETPQLFRGTATSSLTLINAQSNTQGNFYLKTTDQSGTVTVYGPYRLTVDANCRAREVAQVEIPSQVELAPNPIQQDRLRAIVRGAEGRSLQVDLVDLSGKPVRQQRWQQAEAHHVIDWDMQTQSSGMYLLQVVSEAGNGVAAQRQSVKVVKP